MRSGRGNGREPALGVVLAIIENHICSSPRSPPRLDQTDDTQHRRPSGRHRPGMGPRRPRSLGGSQDWHSARLTCRRPLDRTAALFERLVRPNPTVTPRFGSAWPTPGKTQKSACISGLEPTRLAFNRHGASSLRQSTRSTESRGRRPSKHMSTTRNLFRSRRSRGPASGKGTVATFRQWRHAPPPRGGLLGTVTRGPGHDRVPAVNTTAINIAVCR